ncbi:hypothetical protein sce6626 [Sorangium cellulosum So ce56]|uniref:AbiJ-NTD3 domain-containing protein n=1 Tax=Sorangium cellulosum (strain So ce56) TaxID=448385 RepID=A9GPR4_SORC5|nr:hypothetical protein sce6626 [Sorangium cellulosum So ce56]
MVPKPPSINDVRDAIGRALQKHVKDYNLAAVCTELGITPNEEGKVTSKWRTVLNWMSKEPEQVMSIAERVVERFPTYDLEEVVWKRQEEQPGISELARRKLLADLANLPNPWGELGVFAVVDPLFPLKDFPSHASLSKTLADDMERHMVRNPGDWGIEMLAHKLGMLSVSGRRFRLFLEALLDPKLHDEAEQKRYIDTINPHLRRCGWELRVVGDDTGYPIYRTVPLHRGVEGRPKNIIFASSVKPDLRFTDAINNDIEIVTHKDEVLVYDRPIASTGLRWRDLQQWWAEQRNLDPASRKTTVSLYKRLRSSLPQNSPPQYRLFQIFYAVYKDSFPDLPALLPEVWLHYDPRTVAERGRDALLRQRMDFLMLFSHGVRVVIEVDGRHHYADANGRADPAAYAKMAAADRDLRLAGYEVYRFGAAELVGPEGEEAVAAFFRELFRLHPP